MFTTHSCISSKLKLAPGWSRWKNTEAFCTLISDILTHVYNLCKQKCYVPAASKQAKVVPLFKSGKSSDTSNYRPVSVLSAVSKPFEKHTNKHILAHLNKNNLLHQSQSGFRENHSCHTALTSLVDQWLSSMNGITFCGALFADFAIAFDVIDHDLLFRKSAVNRLSLENSILISKLIWSSPRFCS